MFRNKYPKIFEIIKKDFKLNEEKCEIIVNNCINKIKEKIKKDNLKSLVVGISGGLDSAVIASICQQKNTGIPLIGISIPISSSKDHREKAKWVGNNFCSSFDEFLGFDNFNEKESKNLFDSIFKSIEDTNKIAEKVGFKVENFPKNILSGNIKARLRMIVLYDMARKTNGLVMSTDNYSEYLMGFWTINGDVGDFGLIQNIYKGLELPYIAKYLGIREDIIEQKPSDGLMITDNDTDEAQLGANYEDIDCIMIIKEKYPELYGKIENDEIVKKIIKRYYDTSFKRIGYTSLKRKEIGLNY